MSVLTIETPVVFEPFLQPSRYKGAYGGRGCVHGDTLIDTPNGQVKIKDFLGGRVYAVRDGVVIEALATLPREYTKEQLYEVCLNTGQKIICTDEHKFLTHRGWVELQHLSSSDAFVVAHDQEIAGPLLTTLGNTLSGLRANVRHYWQILVGYLGDCSLYFRQCGQPLPLELNSGQLLIQQQADALRHSYHASCRKDVQECVYIDTPSSALLRPSSRGVALGVAGRYCASAESCIDGIFSELTSVFYRLSKLFPLKKDRNGLDQQPPKQDLNSCNPIGLVQNQKTRLRKLCDIALCNRSFYSSAKVNDVIILTGLRYIRKHSRQKYWDIHVYGVHNYLSNGIANHNSGKSHFFAELMIEENIRQKLDNVCLRETLKSLEFSVKKLLETKISSLNAGSYFDVQDRRILTRRGGVIIFEGLQNHTKESIKSLEGFNRAWVEEAQAVSQTSLDTLRPTIRTEGSELWFSWNPAQPTDPIEQLLRTDNPPPDAIVVKVNHSDNPYFPEELKMEMEYDRKRDFDKYTHIWEGEYQQSSEARIFKNWEIEEFERPAGTIYRLGADWGFSVDPSVLVRCSIEGNRLYVDYESYMIGCEIVKLPDLFDRVPESRKWFITADSARPETISHMVSHGYPLMNKARKGSGSIDEGIAFLQSFDIIVHPRCIHLIDELKSYSYKRDPLTDEILPVIEDKNNHVIDALRYACEGARHAAPMKKKLVRPTRHIV